MGTGIYKTIRCYQETSFDTLFAELESFRDLAAHEIQRYPESQRQLQFRCNVWSHRVMAVMAVMAPTCKVCSSVRFFSKVGEHKLPGFGTLKKMVTHPLHSGLLADVMCTSHYIHDLSYIWFVQKQKHIPSSPACAQLVLYGCFDMVGSARCTSH